MLYLVMSRYGILSSVRDRYLWHEIPRDRDLPNPIPNSGSGFTEPDPESGFTEP
jgi:hypothetical protein